MKADVRGVGGFLEDLPVLVFVLIGTMAVISTSVLVAEKRAEIRSLALADREAEKLLDELLALFSCGSDRSISIERLRAANASQVGGLCPLDYRWQVSVIVIHPWTETINVQCEACAQIGLGERGYANRVVNALYGTGGSAFVEVSCVVWRA